MTPEQLAASGTEHGEQAALMCHAAIAARSNLLWALLYAIPNGGERNKVSASQIKAEGVKSGIPDLCLPVARGGYHALYIELKKLDGGTISANQRKWNIALNEQGNAAVFCYGWINARIAIDAYLAWPATVIY